MKCKAKNFLHVTVLIQGNVTVTPKRTHVIPSSAAAPVKNVIEYNWTSLHLSPLVKEESTPLLNKDLLNPSLTRRSWTTRKLTGLENGWRAAVADHERTGTSSGRWFCQWWSSCLKLKRMRSHGKPQKSIDTTPRMIFALTLPYTRWLNNDSNCTISTYPGPQEVVKHTVQ